MALRIRRGLSSDRTSITPEQGEFLYTTDTYQVYIGDGTTPGGNPLYTLASLGGIGLTDLSANSPLGYDNTTGVFSIQVATATQSGFLSNTNWVTFNNKQDALTLTNVGTSGAATLVGNTLNIPIYGSGGGGGGSGTVTSVSVVSANGLAGTVATATSTPAITLSTTITGLLKGNGTAISAATAGTDYQSPLSGTGIVVSSGGTISYITNNSTNWDTAYSNRITSLTTTGSSGSATLISNVLNIPTYTLAGLGGIGLTALSSTATGLTYTNTTGVFSLTSGYVIPTTTSESNWNTAYGWGNHASAGYLTSASAASTYTPLTRNITIDGVTQSLAADRTFTISKSLNDLTDVTISSLAGGDLLQYSTGSSQWVNVPLSALTSIGAVNGLSYSVGNVALGGTLDYDTTINTYKSSTTTQYALTFTSGSSAFSSAGTAPLKITETTANSTGRSAFYVGATDNHAIYIEGRGTPVTTAPSAGFERSSANLLKNATIYSKSVNGVGLYSYLNPNETFTGKTNYVSATIPATVIEKTTGLYLYSSTSPSEIAEQPNDKFFRNQIHTLLSLRLSRGGTSSDATPYQGIETSFELDSAYGATSPGITKIASLKAYRVSNSHRGSEFSISTRLNTEYNGARSQEYEGLRLANNGILTLPAYAEKNANIGLYVNITGGVINYIISTASAGVSPKTIMYGDAVSIVIIDEAGTATSLASATPQINYKVARVRLTNRGSGYTVAPAVTFTAGTFTAAANAILTSTGEVDYIEITNAGAYNTSAPSVTIAAPPSGVQATGQVELGEGYFVQGNMISGGTGYTSGKTRAELVTQVRTAIPTDSILGVNSDGQVYKFKSNLLSLDYLINSSTGATVFGAGGNILNTTNINSASDFNINGSAKIQLTAQSDASLVSGTTSVAGVYSRSVLASNPYFVGSATANMSAQASTYGADLVVLSTDAASVGSDGSLLSFLGTIGSVGVQLYMSSSSAIPTVWSTSHPSAPDFSGRGIGLKIIDDNYSYGYLSLASGSLDLKIGGNVLTGTGYLGTAQDELAFTRVQSSLIGSVGRAYDDAGGVYSITSSAFVGDDPGSVFATNGTYVSRIDVNSVTNGSPNTDGIKLSVESTYTGGSLTTGVSSIYINNTDIFLSTPATSSRTNGDVLTLANAGSGQLGYTTLATVATSGAYSDLSGTPSLATVATSGAYSDLSGLPSIPTTLDSLTDVSAASPTNGQVLAYNTGASAWQAQTFSASGLTLRTNGTTNGSQTILNLKQGTNITITDDGVGGVTISSTGGGTIGLDSVFMLMGA